MDEIQQGTDQAHYLEMLVGIARLLATLDLDAVLLQMIKLTTDAVGAARGSFFLLNEQGVALQRFIAARNYDPQMRAVVSQQILERGLAGWVIANGQAALVEDTASDERWLSVANETDPAMVRSALCVPFFVEGHLRGVITLEHPRVGHFHPLHLRLVEAAANQASAALRNAQLFDRTQAQQRQLEAVLNSIDEGLLVLDQDGRLRVVNEPAIAILGLGDMEPLGKRPEEIAAISGNPFLASLAEELKIVPPGEGKQTFELRDENSRRDFAVNIAPIQRDGLMERGCVIALHDITSLKDLNRLKTHMIQMASHDLKNPIGVLRGYLDVIRSDVDSGHIPDPTFLQNMYRALMRMETLVVNLLDIQRADQDAPLKREPINPYELLQAVVDDMVPTTNFRQQTLIQDIQPNIQSIKGDFARLREAMNNLLENASKYTPDGGTITVTMSAEDERLNFAVRDTGYGIPADQQSRVFQPYFRAKQEQTARIGGTGVGLSLVKEVIERHGGNVWFTSVEHKGSTFGFWLPILN